MIAISEHLRNHGFDPDVYRHTRIPNIWKKLRTYYDLDIIDEREYFDDDESDQKYVDFSLPRSDFLDSMMRRAVADSSEAATSPPELDYSAEAAQARKRKKLGAALKARNMDAEETEEGEDAPSPVARPTRELRGRTRAARQSKQTKREKIDRSEKNDKAETTEEENTEEDDDDEEDDDEDEHGGRSDEEGEESPEDEDGTPASRSTRAAARKNAAPKPAVRRTRLRR